MPSIYCPPDLANPFFPALGQAKQKPHGNARPPIALERPVKVAEELADFMIDVIFATSDVMAIGVLRKLREYGRTVPGKISVGGYDNIPWAAFVERQFTTIRQPVTALGERTMATFIACIAPPQALLVHYLLPVNLIERALTTTKKGAHHAGHR